MDLSDKKSVSASPWKRRTNDYAAAVNAVAVRKRKKQKRWALKTTAARQPVSGARSLSMPSTRASEA
jgi:hypothetical protein